jgi:hypothetical protein
MFFKLQEKGLSIEDIKPITQNTSLKPSEIPDALGEYRTKYA